MNKFNEQQWQVITSEASTLAVIASPGTGKTATLVERIRVSVIDDMIESKNIVVLTFTNAGALEVTRRLPFMVRFVGTLHAYCFGLLQRYGSVIGYREGAINLIDQKQSDELLAQVAKELGYKGSKSAIHKQDPTTAFIWSEYHHRLKRNNLVDYDGVLAQIARLLTTDRGVALREACDELYVDEAQDSASIDWVIYRLLQAKHKIIIGDPDQSVFGFRGAWPAGFIQFAADAHEHVKLELNYRSGSNICAAATRLIEHNVSRLAKSVVPADPREDTVAVASYGTERIEKLQIIAHINSLAAHYPFDDMAILLRRNDLCAEFRDALRANSVPVAGFGEKTPLPPDYGHGMDVLRMCHDPRNDLIAERVLAKAFPDALPRWKEEATRKGVWLTSAMQPVGEIEPLAAPHFALLQVLGCSREFQLLVKERWDLLPRQTLTTLIHDLFNHEQWTPQSKGEPGVTVSTVHAFKGREAKVVFLPAFEQGVLPTMRKDSTSESLEEERRLAFVAVTRAKDRLYISWSKKRFVWGRSLDQQPSVFLREMGLLPVVDS